MLYKLDSSSEPILKLKMGVVLGCFFFSCEIVSFCKRLCWNVVFFTADINLMSYPPENDGQRRALAVKATHFLNFFLGSVSTCRWSSHCQGRRVNSLTCVNEAGLLS